MAQYRKPIPKNQSQITQEALPPAYLQSQGKPSVDTLFTKNRALQTTRKTDKIKDISVGLQDIDYAIKYYFDNIIKPTVVLDGQLHSVSVEYASPERWKSVQADGYYRDSNGKVNIPLIIYKRTNVEKNRNLGNKIDGNNASLYQVFETRYNQRNQYDNFSVLTNRIPNKQYYISVIPDYVTITYDVVVFTNYVEQNNKIIEAIEYASDSYWGDPNRWHFRTMLDNLATTTTINTGEDRFAQTTISLRVYGYLVPDSVNATLSKQSISYSTSQIVFGLEVVGDVNETFNAASQIAASQVAGSTSFIGGGTNITNNTLTQLAIAEAEYLQYSAAFKADSTTSTTATFANRSIKLPPAGSNIPVPTVNEIQFFANGVQIPAYVITSLEQTVGGLVLTVVTTGPNGLGYELTGKEIMIVGKIE
jgi:hypothetical protein